MLAVSKTKTSPKVQAWKHRLAVVRPNIKVAASLWEQTKNIEPAVLEEEAKFQRGAMFGTPYIL